jgi:hypothetical protein
MAPDNGWNEHRLKVTSDILELKQRVEQIDRKVDQCLIGITALKVRSGIWGLMGGMAAVAIGLGAAALKG